jgi:two-component system, chemotaxis family, chemotaxis protein CheY
MIRRIPVVALVDDDKIFRLTASKTITSSSLTDRILQFENGEDALTFLKENASNVSELPDYIFLDINMPYVDGWMFLDDYQILKSTLKKDITIYMVSSSIDPRDMSRAKENSDIRGYVLKPVSKEKFIELLKDVA